MKTKNFALTFEQLDTILSCLEQRISIDRARVAKLLKENGGDYEDSLVKDYKEDEEKFQDLHEYLAGWRFTSILEVDDPSKI